MNSRNVKRAKSPSSLLIVVSTIVFSILLLIVFNCGKTFPPRWLFTSIIIYEATFILIAIIIKILDSKNPLRTFEMAKYWILPFIKILIEIWIFCSVSLLVETSNNSPVSYENLVNYLTHNIIYLIFTAFVMLLIHKLLFKIQQSKSMNPNKLMYLLLVLLILGSAFGLIVLWSTLYGHYEFIGKSRRSAGSTIIFLYLGGEVILRLLSFWQYTWKTKPFAALEKMVMKSIKKDEVRYKTY